MDLNDIPYSELIRLCVEDGAPEVWTEFVRRYQRPIARTIFRICSNFGISSPHLTDDLVQDTLLRLCSDRCRLLRKFVPTAECADPFTAFLKTIAANVAHDYLRQRMAKKRGGGVPGSPVPDGTEDHAMSDLWSGAQSLEQEVQLREIERAMQAAPETAITSSERLIFNLYYRQGFTASAIATIPAMRLSTKGVESALHRVTQYLRTLLTSDARRECGGADNPEGERGSYPIQGEEV